MLQANIKPWKLSKSHKSRFYVCFNISEKTHTKPNRAPADITESQPAQPRCGALLGRSSPLGLAGVLETGRSRVKPTSTSLWGSKFVRSSRWAHSTCRLGTKLAAPIGRLSHIGITWTPARTAGEHLVSLGRSTRPLEREQLR